MQHRERGAAHINIYFFLVLLVMFLGTLWFGYLQMSKVNAAEEAQLKSAEKLAIAQRDQEQLKRYVTAITNVVGSAGNWDDSKDYNYAERFGWQDKLGDNQKVAMPKALTGVSSPSEVKSVLQSLAGKLGIIDSLATPIATFAGKIHEMHLGQLSVITGKNNEVTVAKTATAKAKANASSISSGLTSQMNTASGKYSKRVTDLVTENKRRKRETDNAQAQVRQANDTMSEQRDTHLAATTVLNKKIQRREGQLEFMKSKVAMINPPQAADGAFINASHKAMVGWINIGRKDMLPVGTKFRITNAAGTKTKGHCEVVKVDQDNAEVRLSNVVSRHDPIAEGDKIYSPIYGPNLKRDVALIGRFSYPYTKPMITKLLRDLGNVVHDDVKVGVDLVIVGLQDPNEDGTGLKPVSDIPGYKEAEKLRIELITVHKIRHLLKLGE